MVINLDENKTSLELNCLKIELNSKPYYLKKTIDSESTLLIVVDMINGFCKSGALYSDRCKAIIPNVYNLLQGVPRAKKMFVRDCHNADATEFKWFPEHCHNLKESQLVDELKKIDAVDVPKNSTNGFFALIKKLPDLNYFNNIVVVGVCTDICVMQLSLTLRAYLNEINATSNVLTFTDCVETYNSPIHNGDLMNMFALKVMEQNGIGVFKNIK